MKRVFCFVFMIRSFCNLMYSQGEGYLQINSSEGSHFIVKDELGRKCGGDPRGIHADTVYAITFFREIPNASYAFGGIGSLKPEGQDISYMEFMFNPISPEADGKYELQVIGTKLDVFSIDLSFSRRSGTTSDHKRFLARGVIEKDSVNNYRFAYSGALGVPITLTKLVTSRSLLQDLSAMRKLAWIKDQVTADKYVGLGSSYGTQFQQKEYGAARATLEAILQTISTDSVTGLTTDACKLLREDTQQLLNELPPAVTSLNPAFVLTASGGFSLTVNGLPFSSGDSVSWNGSSRPTAFISSTELRASIPAGDVAKLGTYEVSVTTPEGRISNSLLFYVISSVNWVDTLISYKHRALDLGWIKDKGIANSLDQKLDNAKAQLVKNNKTAAKNILQAFINEVEAQKDKHLSSEGYALLKFNAEYLISKLTQ